MDAKSRQKVFELTRKSAFLPSGTQDYITSIQYIDSAYTVYTILLNNL